MIATSNTAAIETTLPLFAPAAPRRGEVSIHAELSHLSRIVYAVPNERVRRLLPANFETGDFGCNPAQISITSFLDLGARRAGEGAFEETNYRLHGTRAGHPVSWLLGASIGSLAGVAKRQMWQSPWHLGAMEFHARFNPAAGRYQDYQLRTQSQWANAAWAIADSGEMLKEEHDSSIEPSGHGVLQMIQPCEITDHFTRRDGSIGARRLRFHRPCFTRGRLLAARCDLLERLGLLTREELMQPALVGLQHAMTCTFDAPQSESRTNSLLHAANRLSAGH